MLPPPGFAMREPGVSEGGILLTPTMTPSPKTVIDTMVQRVDDDLTMNMFDNCLVPDVKGSSPGRRSSATLSLGLEILHPRSFSKLVFCSFKPEQAMTEKVRLLQTDISSQLLRTRLNSDNVADRGTTPDWSDWGEGCYCSIKRWSAEINEIK